MLLKIFLIWVIGSIVLRLTLLKPSGRIETLYYDEEEDIASFFIPGINGPPKEVFETYAASVAGNVYLVHHSHHGFSPKLLARQIEQHAKNHGYNKINIYSISVGCKVAQKLEKNTDNSVLLNPCLKPAHLKPGLRMILQITTPILVLLRIALGILADLPILPIDGTWRSLSENFEQLFYIAWVPYDFPRNIRGVILSQEDQFLDNNEIMYSLENDKRKQLFRREEVDEKVHYVKNIVLTDIGHADIRQEAYLTAGRKLGVFAP